MGFFKDYGAPKRLKVTYSTPRVVHMGPFFVGKGKPGRPPFGCKKSTWVESLRGYRLYLHVVQVRVGHQKRMSNSMAACLYIKRYTVMLNNNTLHLLMERQDRQCSTLSRNANPDDNIEYSNVHRLYMSDAHIIAPSSLLTTNISLLLT